MAADDTVVAFGGGVGVEDFDGVSDFAIGAGLFDGFGDLVDHAVAGVELGVADVDFQFDFAGDGIDCAGVDAADAGGGDGIEGVVGAGGGFDR